MKSERKAQPFPELRGRSILFSIQPNLVVGEQGACWGPI